LVAVIWGFAFVAQVVGAEELSCMSYNGIRFTLGSVSLIPVIMIFSRKKPEKKVARNTLIASVCGGIVLFIASDLQQWGVQFTETAGKAGFITGLYIVLVPIAQLILFRKSTPLTVWIGAVSAVCGLYLLSMTGAYKVELGDILLIIGAFFWTAHILIIDHFNETGVDALRLACGQFAVCGVLNLIGALIFEPLTITAVQSALLPLLYGGLMSVGVAYTLQIIGQRDAEPTTASIIMSLESLFSCVGGVLFLHEIMAPSNYIGCVLMLTGTVLAQIPGKKKS
ncbi:MAG: DMT family transporter, partial [Clostridia bacterium]|nr:DMT family transporter [Clostridia bacterium]